MDKFSSWLDKQLKKREWTQADLVRSTGLDSSVISNIVNEKRGAGVDTCTAIAHALGIPPEEVFRAAGLLPPNPKADPAIEEILHLARQLPPDDLADLLND